MKNRTPLHLKKRFRKDNGTIGIVSRTETLDSNGYPTFVREDTISVYAMIYMTEGFDEEWYDIGFEKDVDYVISLDATVDVERKDIVILPDNTELIVEEVLERGSGYLVQYQELLCNGVKQT